MPPSRVTKSRGSYAKYICLNCRSRKIKCVLPQDTPGPGIQKPTHACQRCRSKGLTCEVVNTTLGRPTVDDVEMTRRVPTIEGTAEGGDGRGDDLTVDEYLLAHPEPSEAKEEATRPKKPTKSEKFDALFSPIGMLSMLVSRDKRAAGTIHRQVPARSVLELLDMGIIQALDEGLVWHRLFYPDIPPLSALLIELQDMDGNSKTRVPTALLLAVLCRMSLEISPPSVPNNQQLVDALDNVVYYLGQQLLFLMPKHRYSVLVLELMLEYAPFALTFDGMTAHQAVKGELHKALLAHLSVRPEHRTDRSTDGLASDTLSEAKELLASLQWCRVKLIDASVLSKPESSQEPSVEEVQDLWQAASTSASITAEAMHAFQALLVRVKERDSLTRLYQHWRDLDQLDALIQTHKTWCDQQSASLRTTLELKPATKESSHILTTLLASDLHASHSKITAHAMFLCLASGARPPPPSTSTTNEHITEAAALDTSENIITRLTDPTLSQSAHTLFLAKHGASRLEVLERTLLNFLRDARLERDGAGYHPPARRTVSEVLFVGRDVLEQNAARLKGWGALGDRSEVFGLLFKEIGEVMGRTSRREGLWGLGGRVMKGYVETMKRWERWSALGAVRAETESLGRDGETPSDAMSMDDADFFVDWNAWLNDSPELWEWLE